MASYPERHYIDIGPKAPLPAPYRLFTSYADQMWTRFGKKVCMQTLPHNADWLYNTDILMIGWGVWLDRHLIPTALAKLFCLGFLNNQSTYWYQKICLFNTFAKMYNIIRFIWKNCMKNDYFDKENIKSSQNLMQWKMTF